MQQLILVAVLACIAVFLFAAFGIGPKDMEAFFQSLMKPRTLRDEVRPKKRRLLTLLVKTQAMLRATGRSGSFYTLLSGSVLLLIGGMFLGFGVGNYFLLPVLALGAAAIPFVFIRFQYIKYHRVTVEELETALSTISLSYERTENILKAVEENLAAIRPPVRRAFEEFVDEVRFVNPNLSDCIEHMKARIDHSVFVEWCDTLKQCVHDRNLKYTLRPIVEKLTRIRNVTIDLENILHEPLSTYWGMALISVAALGVSLFVLPSSFGLSLPASLVQLLIALNAAVLGLTLIYSLILSKDVQFDV